MGTDRSAAKQNGELLIPVPVPSTTSVVPTEFGQSLPLVARSIQWARLVDTDACHSGIGNRATDSSPIKKSLETMPDFERVVDSVTRFLSHQELMRHKKRVQLKANQHWEATLTRKSGVVLGQLAFPSPQAQKLETRLKSSKTAADIALNGVHKRIASLQRAFVTTVPRMTHALEAVPSISHPRERLLIRMVPISAHGLPTNLIDGVPELEIIMKINTAEESISLRNARLVLMHEELDLLLPSYVSDLRFIRRSYLHCNREQIDPCLIAFVEASQLNIWRSERLRTPNNLRLSIPASSIPRIKEHAASVDGNDVTVEYTFAGLEHRSQLDLDPVGNRRPQYNTIEAGRASGRREELAINLRSPTGQGRRLTEREKAKDLLEAALTMIGSIG